MFDRIASRYDTLNHVLSFWQDAAWRKRLAISLPHLKGHGHVLDIATGTGNILLAIARLRPEYKHLIGVDISQKMLAIARKKASSHENPINFLHMPAEELIYPKDSFDIVTIAFGLRNFENPLQGLKESHRVLKPGGSLFIMDFFPSDEGLLKKWRFFYFQKILPLIGGLFSDPQAYHYLPKSVASFLPVAQLTKSLLQIGFRSFKETSFSFGFCHLIIAEKPFVVE